MCSEALARATRPLLVVLALVAGSEAAVRPAAAAPTKAESARKGYDFRRPDPGEILPNPSTGNGPPPQLMQYSPSANMDEAGGGTASGGPSVPAAEPAPAAPAGQPAASADTLPASPAPGGGAPAADTGTAAPPAPPQAPTTPGVQTRFAAAVARSGIAATLAYTADGGTMDPARGAADEQVWSHLSDSLAASRAAWERRRSRLTGTASDAVVAVVAPGQVTLLRAPGRVTGAFDRPGSAEQTSTGP